MRTENTQGAEEGRGGWPGEEEQWEGLEALAWLEATSRQPGGGGGCPLRDWGVLKML